MSAALATIATIACDIEGTPHDRTLVGPLVSIVGTSLDADGLVPADGVIQLAFDRYLLPATITRQSFAIVDNTNASIGSLAIKTIYDPVARTVTIAGPEGPGKRWLVPDQSYKLVLPVPEDAESDIGGFRAIDRATLDPAQRRQIVFRAGPETHRTAYEPAVDFCTDVLPVFVAKCSSATCHGATESAAAGLVLASADGVLRTARARIARGSNVGARTSTITPTPSVFGENMAIIEPGDPGSSWLTYKLEIARPRAVDTAPKRLPLCRPPEGEPLPAPPAEAFVPLTPTELDVSDGERARLDDLVLGSGMPYPSPDRASLPSATGPTSVPYFYAPLDAQERERIRIWIARGAQVRECGTCTLPQVADADAGSAGP